MLHAVLESSADERTPRRGRVSLWHRPAHADNWELFATFPTESLAWAAVATSPEITGDVYIVAGDSPQPSVTLASTILSANPA